MMFPHKHLFSRETISIQPHVMNMIIQLLDSLVIQRCSKNTCRSIWGDAHSLLVCTAGTLVSLCALLLHNNVSAQWHHRTWSKILKYWPVPNCPLPSVGSVIVSSWVRFYCDIDPSRLFWPSCLFLIFDSCCQSLTTFWILIWYCVVLTVLTLACSLTPCCWFPVHCGSLWFPCLLRIRALTLSL